MDREDRMIDTNLLGLAKMVLNRHVRRLAKEHGRKRAANFARQIAHHVFAEAGVGLVDECSVHDDSVRIMLRTDD